MEQTNSTQRLTKTTALKRARFAAEAPRQFAEAEQNSPKVGTFEIVVMGITAVDVQPHDREMLYVNFGLSYEKIDQKTLAGGTAVAWISREPRDADWDNFLASCPGGHHEHTSLWGVFKGSYADWKPFRIVVTRDGQILGGAQVLTRDFRGAGRIGYVIRGPVASSNDSEIVDFLLEQLHRAVAREKVIYLSVVLPYNGEIFEPGLIRLGFRPKPNGLPPSALIDATVVLDLSPELDWLMAQMRSKTRQHIRQAARKGMTVCEGTGDDVETFRKLMWALCERRGVPPHPPQKDYFERLWAVFHGSGWVKLFNAKLEGETIASVFAISFGDTLRTWKIGWGGDHAKSYPTEMLYWEAIRWAKTNGYRFFDFVWINRDLARKLKNGEPVDWNRVDGITNFKLGFGGTPVVLPQPYYRFYHPVLRSLGQAGGSKFMETAAGERLLGRLLNRLASRGD